MYASDVVCRATSVGVLASRGRVLRAKHMSGCACARHIYRLFTSIDEMYEAGARREEDEAARSGPQAGPHEKIVDDDGDDE